ncbi:uncharacterized protein LOC119796600 [Cyprinodon tularosa]|uniref:uncharacterized protein LOC119796600 n=1 Tax=Cyprinodon tularosa TaxID=77115 RepID=UPI0018E2028E|nr:uncharacterized protein LOC119796600 [Cyprinodon tularosa]
MAPRLSGLLSTFIIFLALCLNVVSCMKVILGDQFIFPISCEPEESGTLLRVLGQGGTLTLATFQSGEWSVIKHRDRVNIQSSRIIFTNVLYADGGIYELSCSKSDNKREERFQLEVVLAWEASVAKDETVLLPCYFETTGKNGLTVQWEKNGHPLCVNSPDGCTRKPGERLSVSRDWSTHGNLSLTVENVQPGDSGDYFCYVQDQHGKQSGNPAAVRLTVQVGNSCNEQIKSWKTSTIVLIMLLLFFVCGVLVNAYRTKGGES